jgi:hypothetical protein
MDSIQMFCLFCHYKRESGIIFFVWRGHGAEHPRKPKTGGSRRQTDGGIRRKALRSRLDQTRAEELHNTCISKYHGCKQLILLCCVPGRDVQNG